MSEYLSALGKHIRALRVVRRLTQRELGERCGVCADTISRMEAGTMSPRIETIRRVACGLDVSLTTLFESFEAGVPNSRRELLEYLAAQSEHEVEIALRVVRVLCDELRERKHA